ncbi:hypothetical protein [Micromonospora echinofusca]|uniref:Nucleotidyltransferase domain-containing protein n=1 Tax=Micromonospora echinofusca TaxID=47858 RepID=A0ABS3VQE2_MICEH|nr:hypothetical protein [Micromonospora echinofusca]MBO4206722.1 hypothetical protein [Micromonospora echinofusca]
MVLNDPVDIDRALDVVGLTLADVLELGGSVLTAGPAYLVGSLAGGLGNRGSDVDIHLLVPGIDKPSPAFLFFAGHTPIDIEHYPERLPATMVAGARAYPVGKLPLGAVSLAPAPGRRTRRTAARWLNALPLHPDQPPVFAPADAPAVLAVLVRAALDQVLQVWAAARLATRVDAGHAGYLWARTGREVLELRCRARGDVLTSEKWLPDRAARLGFDPAFARAHYTVDSEDALTGLLADTGLAGWDPWRLTRLRTEPDRQRVRLGRTEYALTRHGRLVADPVTGAGTTTEIADRYPADRLLAALRDGELTLDVASDALARELDETGSPVGALHTEGARS